MECKECFMQHYVIKKKPLQVSLELHKDLNLEILNERTITTPSIQVTRWSENNSKVKAGFMKTASKITTVHDAYGIIQYNVYNIYHTNL